MIIHSRRKDNSMHTLLILSVSLCLFFPLYTHAQDEYEAVADDSESYQDSLSYTEEDFIAGDMMYRWHVEPSGVRVLKRREIFFDAEMGIYFGPWEVVESYDWLDYYADYFTYCPVCQIYYCNHPHFGAHHHCHFHVHHDFCVHYIHFVPHLCIHGRPWHHCSFCVHWRPWLVWKPWYPGRYFMRRRFVHRTRGTYYAYQPRYPYVNRPAAVIARTRPRPLGTVLRPVNKNPGTIQRVQKNPGTVRQNTTMTKATRPGTRTTQNNTSYKRAPKVISKKKPRQSVPVERYTYSTKKNISKGNTRTEKKWTNVNIVKPTRSTTSTSLRSTRIQKTPGSRSTVRSQSTPRSRSTVRKMR